jgi:hypothetical protein
MKMGSACRSLVDYIASLHRQLQTIHRLEFCAPSENKKPVGVADRLVRNRLRVPATAPRGRAGDAAYLIVTFT